MKFENKPVIGMIHVPALPGTPQNRLSIDEMCSLCVEEARVYNQNGIDAVMIENMNDLPYLNGRVGPEITAAMAVIGHLVKKEMKDREVGIQILAAANKEALAVAKAASLDFIRVEGFVFAHIADEGFINSCAGELLRYRKAIDATQIKIFTDIKKKHSSHSITSDIDIAETAKAAEFFLSDGIIVTGISTGSEPSLEEVKKVKKISQLPVIIGSGINPENIDKFFPFADAFIVGTYLKRDSNWRNSPDPQRIKRLMETIHQLRIS
jgi:membrane complex biogenesis BtpA family protein